jgi:hypothetical protein
MSFFDSLSEFIASATTELQAAIDETGPQRFLIF